MKLALDMLEQHVTSNLIKSAFLHVGVEPFNAKDVIAKMFDKPTIRASVSDETLQTLLAPTFVTVSSPAKTIGKKRIRIEGRILTSDILVEELGDAKRKKDGEQKAKEDRAVERKAKKKNKEEIASTKPIRMQQAYERSFKEEL